MASGASSPSTKGKEFVAFPENYNGFICDPDNQIKLSAKPGTTNKLSLFNRGGAAVLYKIKCTNNSRISILDCAGILESDKEASIEIKRKKYDAGQEDNLCVMYLLLGEIGGDNACIEWRRATEQQIPTKNFIIKIVDA
uniref:Major sperm protein n=1 Tax=Panagrolaimus sp. ES5 TaxID=591445 RepID=A0AC34F8C3_9BILA